MVQKRTNPITFLKNLYNSEYEWAIIKSLGVFLLGVRIAQECVGFEVMPVGLPIPQ